MDPDIVVELPPGWEQLENDGPLTYSPDEGGNVLQISSPSWGAELRGEPDERVDTQLRYVIETGKVGRAVATGWVQTHYGRMLRAEIDGPHDEAIAWLVVPDTHDVLLVTFLGGGSYGDTAREIVDGMLPGLFSAAVASAVGIARESLADKSLHSHAALFGNGRVAQLALETLPQEMWNDICRAERAKREAEVIVQVLAATNDGEDIAVIIAESATRTRKLVVGAELIAELEPERFDFFAPPNPGLLAALDEISREG